ncbi:alpha-arabinofuranosidase II [Decorospora gaudefroyi]|uniref:non-reducing end alpha-L-arabinofuranosidase n=1 Tax=Decorospora gaudefroyi TaxID=184978 RepID=A0A6A5JYY6_9PLEO|nr:alpha-arabinofuranosidase II [Decorospora gaudefroyi]
MRSFRNLVVTATAVVVGILTLTASPVAASPAVSYNNTLISQRADPHIYKHTDGFYYFTATVPAYDKVVMRRSQTIMGLSNAAETTIFARKRSGVGSGYIWAPEIHYIDNKWYIYVAMGLASQGGWGIRMTVLEGTGSNPLTAQWVEKGVIRTNRDTFNLDASTFVAGGTRYLIWAQTEGDGTAILIAPLQNPWTIRGTPTIITRPDQPWERVNERVNEGAYVIQKNGKIFLTYSAAATDSNYCMGLVTADANADLMKASSWTKSKTPVFVSNAKTSQWGPGHNSFTVSEDGQSDIMVYHDRGYKNINGSPLNNPDRRTRVQKLYWKADGTPDFGIPVPDGPTPVRLRSYTTPTLFVTHRNSVHMDANAALADTQFRIIRPGLAGGSTVSLESTSEPGSFLRRSGSAMQLVAKQNSAAFNADASFNQREGLAGSAGVSFEASGAAGQYLRAEGGNNALVVGAVAEAQRESATFVLE